MLASTREDLREIIKQKVFTNGIKQLLKDLCILIEAHSVMIKDAGVKGDANVRYLTMKNGLDESLMNRELLTRMMALSEMMKSLQDENNFLKAENQGRTSKHVYVLPCISCNV